MKYIYLCWLLCFPILLSAQSKKYVINGTVGSGLNQQIIYLYHEAQGSRHTDSCVIKKGTFSFSGTVKSSTWATLALKRPDDYQYSFFMPNQTLFYLQPGVIKLTSPDSLLHAKMSGNPLTNDYQQLRNELQSYEEALFVLEKSYQHGAASTNLDAFISLHLEELKAIMKLRDSVTRSFIETHPESLVSAHVITEDAGSFPDVKKSSDLIGLLSPKIRKTPEVEALVELIEGINKTAIGKLAPEFTQNDTSGRPVSLKSFRGKYVLLDFWASWCKPCRAENPNVVKAYMAYHNKNFTVLSVSLEKADGRQAWINAINKDGMPWTNVSDLKFFNNEAAILYGIKAVPQNFLIDPNGVIISKNLRGEELTKYMSQLFKEDKN